MRLTPGERLVRCLLGESIDRIPFGVGLGWHPWGQTHQRWKRESGNDRLDIAAELGFERSFAVPDLESGVFPRFPEQVLQTTDEFIVTRDWRGITLRNRRDGMSMPDFLDYPVKSPADWQRLKAERLRLDDAPQRVRQDWDAFRRRVADTGEAVQVGTFPWGVFGTPRDLMGAEELLIAFYDHAEMVADMMEHLTSLWLGLWEEVARHVQIDHIHIWEDMSGRQGSLISPDMVGQFMMPCYDRIASFARRHGVRIVSVDTDGDCSQLLPVMMEHGINMMFPFEVAAGNDVLAFRRQYATLGIMGGLDKRALAGTRADIDHEVARAEAMVRQGRYVPGFDHLIPPDVPWDHFRYAAGRIRQVCMEIRS